MKRMVLGVLGLVGVGVLAGCAGPTEQLSMQGPTGQTPQQVTFPNGTTFGGASGRQASELAQIIVDSNNNNMRDYQQLQGTESKNLQTSQQALSMLEQLSNEQGTGQITLFFPARLGRAPPELRAGGAADPLPGLYLSRQPGS
jgi:TolA-binding protein